MDLKNHSMIDTLRQMTRTNIPDIRAWVRELQELLEFLKKHFPDVDGEVHPRPDSLGEETTAYLTLWPKAWPSRKTQVLQLSLKGDKAKAEGPHLPTCWVNSLADLQSKASIMMLDTGFQIFLMECRRLNTAPASVMVHYSARKRGYEQLSVVINGKDILPIASAADEEELTIKVNAYSDIKDQELDMMVGGTMYPYEPHTKSFKVQIIDIERDDNPRVLNLVVRRVL